MSSSRTRHHGALGTVRWRSRRKAQRKSDTSVRLRIMCEFVLCACNSITLRSTPTSQSGLSCFTWSHSGLSGLRFTCLSCYYDLLIRCVCIAVLAEMSRLVAVNVNYQEVGAEEVVEEGVATAYHHPDLRRVCYVGLSSGI